MKIIAPVQIITIILNSLLAPVPYFLLGAVVLSFCNVLPHVYWLSTLLGFCLFGLLGELSLFFHLSMLWLTLGTILFSLVFFLALGLGKKIPTDVYSWLYATYLITLAWNAMVPYPGMGPWSGDWQENVRMGEAVWTGNYTVDLLQRTPLYGGATSPLLLLQETLASFQIASAICSTAVLLVFFFGAIELKRKLPTWTGFLIVLLSPFYSLNAVYLWPKQLAAGCLLASFLFAWKNREEYSFKISFASAFWFAISVSAHQSSIFYLPIWLALTHSKNRKISFLVKDLAILGLLGVVLAGTFEAWAIFTYGLEARIRQNPSVYYVVDRSLYGEIRLMLINTMSALTGWLPYSLPLYLEQHAPGWGITQTFIKVYLTVGVWATNMAGTFLGMLLPFWLAYGLFWKKLMQNKETSKTVLISSLIAFCLVNLVQTSPSAWGVIQTGFVGMALCILFLLVTTEWKEEEEKKCLRYTVLLGTLPVLCNQTAILFFLKLPLSQLASMQKLIMTSEYDARYFFERGMVSLGFSFFPFSVLLAILALILYFKGPSKFLKTFK